MHWLKIFTRLRMRNMLPPANEVWGKVIFLHLFVILFTGGVPDTPQTRYTPLGPDTPPRDQVHPQEQTPPGPGTPSGAAHAGRYGQHAGGMHPTGMQSCTLNIFSKTDFTNCCAFSVIWETSNSRFSFSNDVSLNKMQLNVDANKYENEYRLKYILPQPDGIVAGSLESAN